MKIISYLVGFAIGVTYVIHEFIGFCLFLGLFLIWIALGFTSKEKKHIAKMFYVLNDSFFCSLGFIAGSFLIKILK